MTAASESGANAPWSRSFAYTGDSSTGQYGNLTISGTDVDSLLNCGTYHAATNRCTAPGFGYDDAGNLESYAQRELSYDAENRQKSLTEGGGSPVFTYHYDGEGRRVKKVTNLGTTIYVFDAFGQLAAEYADYTPASQPDCTTCYLTADHLGSTRLVTDGDGDVKKRYDYYPFGGEVGASYGDRSEVAGYGGDWFNPKFTAKVRDYESGLNLDYFGARYYAGAMGRFTSPDPFNVVLDASDQDDFIAHLSDPSTWNKYAYAKNNPLKYVDPTGLDVEIAVSFVGDISDEEKARILGAVRQYLVNQKVGTVVVRDAAVKSDDKRTSRQKLKDFYTVDYHSITVDLKNRNPFGNDADRPNYVKAWNMAATGDPSETFGDLRSSDPGQWSNIIAWRVLHESISHAFGIGLDIDQLVKVGGDRAGTLIEGAYGRGRSGIPGLNPRDTRTLQRLLRPRIRSYGR